ncbi:hypothetical protein HZH68_013536 [Vespula germanica]|uniref:DUF4485 domain-containing protein n=1 Tax=Vespula germanica TaxID=30212 RepID=A0A834MWN2_VESGE|nr:hypothetical protein HZH68_013536 [Vespula germanica]
MAQKLEIEEILDQDFLQFISLAKTYYTEILDEKDKLLCMQWLTKLCGEKAKGISSKRNRNIYLSQLLMNMQEKKMAGPFLSPPGDKPLPPARNIFSSQDSDKIFSPKMETELDEMPDDFQEKSTDGQTYIAIRCLPNDQGTFAYVALNINKEKSCTSSSIYYPSASETSKSKPLDNISISSGIEEHLSEAQMEDFYKHNIEPKISGDIIQLYQSLHMPQKSTCCKQRDGMKFYNKLLKLIDKEITGVENEHNDIIKFLVNRLEQDLKKESKMKHMFKLAPEQKNLKLLEILRQKVVVRLQEEKRRLLIAEMEENMLTSSMDFKCCAKTENGTESMWELAVTKPLTDKDINRLCDLYPEEIISTFLDLLIADRQIILERGKKRQLKMIEKIKFEIDKEIQSDKAIYNKSRETYREWNEILSTVEDMIYDTRNKTDKKSDKVSEPKEGILDNMMVDIKETEKLVVEEAHLGEMLIEKIIEANMWTFSIQEDDKKDESWEMKSAIENMKKQNKIYKLLIDKQKIRIKQLREKLFYNQKY